MSTTHCNGYRKTFRQILAESRLPSAALAWTKARLASDLRRGAIASRRVRTARILGRIQVRALRRAMELGPEQMDVTPDLFRPFDTLRIQWPDHGTLYIRRAALSPLPTVAQYPRLRITG